MTVGYQVSFAWQSGLRQTLENGVSLSPDGKLFLKQDPAEYKMIFHFT